MNAEEFAQHQKDYAALPIEEKMARDPNHLHPEAARGAAIFGGVFLILIMLLVWFILTCQNNKKKLKRRRDHDSDSEDEVLHQEMELGDIKEN